MRFHTLWVVYRHLHNERLGELPSRGHPARYAKKSHSAVASEIVDKRITTATRLPCRDLLISVDQPIPDGSYEGRPGNP